MRTLKLHIHLIKRFLTKVTYLVFLLLYLTKLKKILHNHLFSRANRTKTHNSIVAKYLNSRQGDISVAQDVQLAQILQLC